jgi:hypothetical protein
MTGIVHESAPADNHLFSTFLDLGTLEVVPTIPVDRAPRVDRTARGLALFRSGAVRRVGPARYAVTGSSGTTYMLRAEPGTKRARLTCTCADFVLRQRDLGKACAHISAVSAYFAAKMTKDRPEPEPPPAPARVLPYRPRLALVDTECVTIEAVDPFAHNQVGVDFQPGMRAIARLRGADVEVELGARNPRTKYGAGFWARRLDTGRTVTILSPGCLRVLRPVPSPAIAAPIAVRATEPVGTIAETSAIDVDALVRFATARVDTLKLTALVIAEAVGAGLELIANGFREHEWFEPIACRDVAEIESALEILRIQLRAPKADVPPDARLCPEITYHTLGGR